MKKLTLKNMLETYKASTDAEEAESIWDAFRLMYELDFISWDTWSKFYDECSALEF